MSLTPKLTVLGFVVSLLAGCDQIVDDRVSLDEIVLPSVQKVNTLRPERTESVDTEYIFYGRLAQTLQQKPLLVVSLPSKLADEIPPQQKVAAINRDSRTSCTLAEISESENPPGNRSARFSITPRVGEAGWEVGDSIEVRMTITRDLQGYWIPISALSQSTDGEWSLFALDSGDSEEESNESLRIKVEPVQLVYHEGDWVLVDCANSLDAIVADGTHRIVAGQVVQPRDITKRLIRQPRNVE